MNDKCKRFQLDAIERERLLKDLEYLKCFLRQQNPRAFFQTQSSGKIDPLSLDIVPICAQTAPLLPSTSNSQRKDARLSDDDKGDVQKNSSSMRKLSQSSSNEKVLTFSPPKFSGHLAVTKFDDLIKWMHDNIPDYPLLDHYSLGKGSEEKKLRPILLIVTSDERDEEPDIQSFTAKVSEALSHRNITSATLKWGQWEKLTTFDLVSLKLIIGPNEARKHLMANGNEMLEHRPFLDIDWKRCARDKEQKIRLWSEIKRYLGGKN